MPRSPKRGVRACSAAALGALACIAGCDYDNSWRAESPAASNPWSGSGAYTVSGGWEEAALFFGPVLAVCAGVALVEEIGRLWDEWADDNGIGVTWDSSDGRALRRGD